MPATKTPSVAHLSSADFRNVYEPAEDTYLLTEALEKGLALSTLQVGSVPPRAGIALEVGCGSGYVSAFLGLNARYALSLATDINPLAVRAAAATASANHTQLDVVHTDFADGLRLMGMVDLLVFNPPYVPTPEDEVGASNGISAAWAGGLHGRQVLDRFLPRLDTLLSTTGVAYLVLLHANDPPDVASALSAFGLDMSVRANVLRNRLHAPSHLAVE